MREDNSPKLALILTNEIIEIVNCISQASKMMCEESEVIKIQRRLVWALDLNHNIIYFESIEEQINLIQADLRRNLVFNFFLSLIISYSVMVCIHQTIYVLIPALLIFPVTGYVIHRISLNYGLNSLKREKESVEHGIEHTMKNESSIITDLELDILRMMRESDEGVRSDLVRIIKKKYSSELDVEGK